MPPRSSPQGSLPRGPLMVGVAVVLGLVVIEVVLHFLGGTARFLARRKAEDALLNRPGFAGQPWVPGYMSEFERLNVRFVPFLDWQYTEFHGQAINTDADGLRATANPDLAPGDSRPFTVYVFGGSTVWGTGSRDLGTIPSALSRWMNAAGCRTRVANYGQSGYTSLQGIVRLVLLLREGARPDLVIVYDGVNDTYAAYQSGVPGTNQNVAVMDAVLHERRSAFEHLRYGAGGVLRQHSMIYRAVKSAGDLARGALKPQSRFLEKGASMSAAELDRLATGIVAEYWKSQELLDRLAATYGFKVLRVWQPSAYAQEWEGAARIDPRATDTALRDLYRTASTRLPDDPGRRFVNLSQLFAGKEDSVFVDFVHISEAGNDVVAGRIVEALHTADGDAWCAAGTGAPAGGVAGVRPGAPDRGRRAP